MVHSACKKKAQESDQVSLRALDSARLDIFGICILPGIAEGARCCAGWKSLICCGVFFIQASGFVDSSICCLCWFLERCMKRQRF